MVAGGPPEWQQGGPRTRLKQFAECWLLPSPQRPCSSPSARPTTSPGMRQSASADQPSGHPTRRQRSSFGAVRLQPYGAAGAARVSPIPLGPARAAAQAGPVGVWSLPVPAAGARSPWIPFPFHYPGMHYRIANGGAAEPPTLQDIAAGRGVFLGLEDAAPPAGAKSCRRRLGAGSKKTEIAILGVSYKFETTQPLRRPTHTGLVGPSARAPTGRSRHVGFWGGVRQRPTLWRSAIAHAERSRASPQHLGGRPG